MSRFKSVRRSLWVPALVLGTVSPSAATPSQDFDAQARADLQTIAAYINGQFSKSMGFYSTLGWTTAPGVFDLVSGPRVDAGVGIGADFVSLANLGSLPLGALVTSANVSLPSLVPVPYPVGTFRVGLLNGLDLGFRLSYLPNIDLPDLGFGAHYTGWGLDMRFKILDGLQVPALTGVVSWDTMSGGFTVNTAVSQSSTYNDGGTSYPASVSGNSVLSQDWDVRSFGAKLMVGKDLKVAYPYAGIGFQRHSGTLSASIDANGTETVNGAAQPFHYIVASASAPTVLEPKFMLGFDLGEGFHWAVLGESNGTDIAGTTSFRLQF